MAFRQTLSLFNKVASTSRSVLTSHITSETLPPLISRQEQPHKTLYQHLSTLPQDGIGARVRQRRWLAKGLDTPMKGVLGSQASKEKTHGHLCYWEVTRVKLKDGGNHGKAWGRLFWRGKQVTPEGKDERIRGGLKYMWDAAC